MKKKIIKLLIVLTIFIFISVNNIYAIDCNSTPKYYLTWLEEMLANGDRKIAIYVRNKRQVPSANIYIKENSVCYPDADIKIVISNDKELKTGDIKDGRKIIRYHFNLKNNNSGVLKQVNQRDNNLKAVWVKSNRFFLYINFNADSAVSNQILPLSMQAGLEFSFDKLSTGE